MEIYNDYLSQIRNALNKGTKAQFRNFTGNNSADSTTVKQDLLRFISESKENKLMPSLQAFANELGLQPNYSAKLGAHPDFAYLKADNGYENHYIVSMFIDIRKSTNLFMRYPNETVFIIHNTIMKAAIHTCLVFGGYVQRLQGDALFVYFGGRSIQPKDAVDRALKASSLFSYFVKNDLKNLFNEKGIENIYTRIGIDYGEKEDVLWALAGIADISEITTCSLHTNLASKMQQYAQSNGVVVGDNVKNLSNLEYFVPVCKRTEQEKDRYIFTNEDESFYYTQYDFEWLKFMKHLTFLATDLSGNVTYKSKKPEIRLANNLAPIAEKSNPYLSSNES